MNVMATIAPILAHPIMIGAVVAGLVAWAIWSGIRLRRAATRLHNGLQAASSAVAATPDAPSFAGHYETISASLVADRVLGAAWRAWRDTLLLPVLPGRPLRATARPEAWFDTGLVSGPAIRCDLRYHAALPNLLVGAGLLFTFLGLAAALASASGIVADGVTQAQRNAALHQLLDAASFKFITSIAGLGLSIGYALFRKKTLHGLEHDLAAWCELLESRIPAIAQLAMQQEANQLLQQQATHLETFTTELAVNIGSALDIAFDKRLGEHIGPLAQAMERLAERLETQRESGVERMLDAFLDKLRGGTGHQMEQVAEKLGGLVAGLDGMQTGLQDASGRMAEAAEAMARRMGEGAETALAGMTGQMRDLVETLRSVAEQTRSTGADAGKELAERIAAASIGFEQSARVVAETLAEAARGLERKMGDEADASARRLQEQVQAMVAELRALAANSRQAGDAAMQAMAERIGAAAAGFEVTAEKIGRVLEVSADRTGGALGRGAEQAVERIAAATEGMRRDLGAMMAELRADIGETGKTVRTETEAGAVAFRNTIGVATGTLADSLAAAADTLREAGVSAGGALQHGGEAAGTRLDASGQLLGTRAVDLAGHVAGLEVRLTTLGARIESLQAATSGAAEPLVTAATDMQAAASTTQASMRLLADASQQLRDAADQARGAAQQMEAVQANARALVDAVQGAARKFDGVDQNLAAVCTQLQAGLMGFTRQVQDFVKGTDDNFAKAATQLGAVIRSLDEAIADLPAMPRRG